MMNTDRLYDIIKNIRETLSLMDKAIKVLNETSDDGMREIIMSSIKQSFLEYFILIENYTSLCLKELKLYKISDDMDKSLIKLYQKNIFSEDIYNFLNQYRKYRNRIAHVYKQPSTEEILTFINENRENINEVVDIMISMYKEKIK